MSRRSPEPPPRVCEHCGKTYERRPGQQVRDFNRKRFCDTACSTAWRAVFLVGRPRKSRSRPEDVLEDLEWIIDTDHPERVAARLGYARPEYLIRCLYRWGRMDLAVRLEHGNRLERAS